MQAQSSRGTRNIIPLVLFNVLLLTGLGKCDYNPIDQMCMRWNHQTVVKNNILYIDGGYETFQNTGNGAPYVLGYNKYLIAVPMTDTWNWKTNISEMAIAKTANPQTGTMPPSLIGGAMFQGPAERDEVFTYGGSYFNGNSTFGNPYPDPVTYSLWSYSKGNTQWSQYDISSASTVRPSEGAYTEAPDLGLGFWIGGQVNNASDSASTGLGNNVIAVEGLIVVNMTGTAIRAKNVTATGLASGNVGGSVTYVDNVADKGILIAMGGLHKEVGVISEANGTLASFGTVDIFDVASIFGTGEGAWYSQIPLVLLHPGEQTTVSIVVPAPDLSTHNLYVYGGRDPNTGTLYDDIYVLSLPSFTWIKLFQGQSPRFSHTCHLVGKRQLLTVGGNLSNNLTGGCDWETKGVGIMDLTTNVWGSVYNAYAAPYEITQAIVDVIGGSPKGGASLITPSGGFSSKSVEALFAPRVVNANPSSTSGSTSPSQSPKKKKTSAGVIAGVVIGVLALVAVVAGIAFFFLRRRRQVVEMASPPDSKAFMADRDIGKAELGGESPGTKPMTELAATDVIYHELPASGTVELDGNSYIEASRQASVNSPANVSPATASISPARE